MKTQTIKVDANDLRQLISNVELIKNVLLSEGELTDWAKKELAEARETPDSEYISMEEIEKEFL